MDGKQFYLDTLALSDAREHAAFLARHSEDCEWVVPGAAAWSRRDPRLAGAVLERLSSCRHTVTTLIQENSTVVAEETFRWVHDGVMSTPMGDLPPTGREVTFGFLMIADADLDAHLCTSARIYFDQLQLLGQVGALPDPAAAVVSGRT